MSADTNIKTIMGVYEAFGRGDVAAILDDGVVSWLAVEPGPGLSVSSVEEVLAAL